jgi:glycosyltransferase involved in cell wall biosynthesis
MHVVLAVEELNEIYGGVERTVANMANYLVREGHQVTVLTFEYPGDGEPAYDIDPQVERHYMGLLSKNELEKRRSSREAIKDRLPGFVTAMIRNLLAARRIFSAKRYEIPLLIRAFEATKPDVVVSFKTHFHRYIVPAAARLNIPVIASEHNPPEILYHRYVCAIDRRVIWSCLEKASAIRTLVDSFKYGYPARLRSRCVCVPNGIDLPDTVADTGGPSEIFTIINVGRLYFQKDQATLIRAFATLAETFPQWRVEIYGDGNMEASLRELISRLGLEEKVILKGAVRDVIPAYLNSRIFALPSLFEGFGNVTLEALACGLPVVAFDNCDANRQLVQHENNGLLVPEQNRVDSFARGLERLMLDNDLRAILGRNARESARRFEKSAVMKRWEDLLEQHTTTSPKADPISQ